MLRSAKWRLMVFRLTTHFFKLLESSFHLFRTVLLNGKTTAFFRAIFRKGTDNQMTLYRFVH